VGGVGGIWQHNPPERSTILYPEHDRVDFPRTRTVPLEDLGRAPHPTLHLRRAGGEIELYDNKADPYQIESLHTRLEALQGLHGRELQEGQ
jgi:hypothetical protein